MSVHSNDGNGASGSRAGSILDGLGDAPVSMPAKRPRESAGATLARWWGSMSPTRRKNVARAGGVLALLTLAGGGVWAYIELRPRPTPDYLDDELAGVLDYTLLSNEFNNLPLRERLDLLSKLISRLKGLSSNDSVMMAAFAAGLKGQARTQLEENVSRLVVDAWDDKAKDYGKVPEEDRAKFLENAYVDFEKMLEALGGRVRDTPDEKRLERARRQAQRDREQMRDPSARPDGETLGRLFEFMDRKVGGSASPQQRYRGAQMVRDMSRHFRGEDIETGKPAPTPAPATPTTPKDGETGGS
ncbi:MAG: hypothetical protein AB7Q00_03240 [Phycisphaerales bacterium]